MTRQTEQESSSVVGRLIKGALAGAVGVMALGLVRPGRAHWPGGEKFGKRELGSGWGAKGGLISRGVDGPNGEMSPLPNRWGRVTRRRDAAGLRDPGNGEVPIRRRLRRLR